MWSYLEPLDEATKIAGMMCVWQERDLVSVEVDGELVAYRAHPRHSDEPEAVATRHAAGQRLKVVSWEMVGYGESIHQGRDRDISVACQAEYLVAWMDSVHARSDYELCETTLEVVGQT